MLWLPQKGVVKVIGNDGIVGATLPGTGVPGNATTLLDGAITEVISAAANTQDSWGFMITISHTGTGGVAGEACMDVLIGGATDDVLIGALICGYGERLHGTTYFFPLHIPQGKRIACRFASVRTGITAQVIIRLYGGSPPPWRVGRKVTTYGVQINNCRGQEIIPAISGGAATVTELAAATTEDHFAFMPGFQPATDITITTGFVNIGIGVGADPADRIGTWWYATTSAELLVGSFPAFPAFRDVPAGTRLTVLASNSIAVNDGSYDALVYGVS